MGRKTIVTGDRSGGFVVVVVGLALLAPSVIHSGLNGLATGGMALAGMIVTGVGLVEVFKTVSASRQLPKKEVMRLAEERGGLLTVSEITTALDIDPDRAKKTLQALSKDGIAAQRWEEFRKNLWEFPDYLKLPIVESIELAKAKGGRLSVQDLVASGHSPDTARQTLDALNSKGLAQEDPANSATSDRAIIVTTQ